MNFGPGTKCNRRTQHRSYSRILSRFIKYSQEEAAWAQVNQGGAALREARAELAEARKQWHALQVEIETLHAMEKGLETSLQQTQRLYSSQLQDLSQVISRLEGELEQVRNGLATQRQRHNHLLNTKMRLEREISTYRRLLEREEGRYNCNIQLVKHMFKLRDIDKRLQLMLKLIKNVSCVSLQDRKDRQSDQAVEGSFFRGNPKLRKKSVSLRFDLHMSMADEGCAQTKQDSLPDVEVRLVMKRSRSIASITHTSTTHSAS
uniref:Keratin 222 n=1 Tax=Neogobius melanostomus TaxID=47308 RepID=A0A8C6SMG6_9GOBI